MSRRRKRSVETQPHRVTAQFPPVVRRRLQLSVDRAHKWKAEAPPFAKRRSLFGPEWDRLERELGNAIRAGEIDSALRAVEAWENEIREALKVGL